MNKTSTNAEFAAEDQVLLKYWNTNLHSILYFLQPLPIFPRSGKQARNALNYQVTYFNEMQGQQGHRRQRIHYKYGGRGN